MEDRVSLVVELIRACGTDGRPASRRRIRESYRVIVIIDNFKQVDVCIDTKIIRLAKIQYRSC